MKDLEMENFPGRPIFKTNNFVKGLFLKWKVLWMVLFRDLKNNNKCERCSFEMKKFVPDKPCTLLISIIILSKIQCNLLHLNDCNTSYTFWVLKIMSFDEYRVILNCLNKIREAITPIKTRSFCIKNQCYNLLSPNIHSISLNPLYSKDTFKYP